METDNPYKPGQAAIEHPLPDSEPAAGKILTHRGRFNRSNFLFWTSLCSLASMALVLFAILFFEYMPGAADEIFEMSIGFGLLVIILTVVLGLFLVVAAIYFDIRRLHDMNRSGYWELLIIAAYFAIYWVDENASSWILDLVRLPLFLIPGTTGQNNFGPVDRAPRSWTLPMGIFLLAGAYALEYWSGAFGLLD